KFDPISTHDYYAMAGIFKSSELLNGYASRQGGGNNRAGADRFHQIAGDDEVDNKAVAEAEVRRRQAQKKLQALKKEVDELKSRQKKMARDKAMPAQKKKTTLAELRSELRTKSKSLNQMQKRMKQMKNNAPTVPVAMGLRDMSSPADAAINIKGDAHRLGRKVARGYPAVLHFDGQPVVEAGASGRRELAEWLLDPQHPLTARVMVNRVWHHLFGRGIVRTVDNFGITGERPSHPELLDFLAARFIDEQGWSVKTLIRDMVTSRAYRAGSQHLEANYAGDPDNIYLWRMNRKRLEAEALRDAILLAGGELNLEPLAGSPVSAMAAAEIRDSRAAPNSRHRSVYLPIIRDKVPPFLTLFDFPTPSEVKGARDITTVAPQALFFMNNPKVIQQARALSGKLLNDESLNDTQRIRRIFLQTVGRRPAEAEVAGIAAYLDERIEEKVKPDVAWSEAVQSLFASVEFRTLN
ncbi:MAG: DUF1553 domain-containing protein, partial [Verrucomicrobiota bacterium]